MSAIPSLLKSRTTAATETAPLGYFLPERKIGDELDDAISSAVARITTRLGNLNYIARFLRSMKRFP
jgi:hypothetical protein